MWRVVIKSDVNAVLWDDTSPSLPILLDDASQVMVDEARVNCRRKFRIELSGEDRD